MSKRSFLTPYATEKVFSLQTEHKYSFLVPMSATKQEIAAEVKNKYNVTPISVHTIVRKGKPMRISRGKHAYPAKGYRPDMKFAYVTIKSDETIAELMPQVEEPETKEDKKEDKK